ncbi:hypothetical protein [Catellatospora sp. NPDC049609]|uniref:hypothetical protein n=1 Tax=Catellatospora sp. NPDC049609 TaxID=3155505 RepID=UPI0034161B70
MTIAGRCRMAGLAIGVGLAFALAQTSYFDLATVALGLTFTVGVLAGQLATPRTVTGRGAASLRDRRVRDYVPRDAAKTVAAITAALGVFAIFPTPDRPGGEIRAFGTAAPVSLLPTLATLGTVLLLAAIAVRAVVRTPQRGADERQRTADEQWRRGTVRTLAAACATLFTAVFTACAFWYAGAQLDWRSAGGPLIQSQSLGYLLALAGGTGLVLLIRFGAVLAGATPSDRGASDSAASDPAVPSDPAGAAAEPRAVRAQA